MGRGYSHRSGEAHCCMACGRQVLWTIYPELIFEEREEWKPLGAGDKFKSAIVKAEDIEGMYFYQEHWVWAAFSRTILDNPFSKTLRVSGITQNSMLGDYSTCPTPRDPRIARIGNASLRRNNPPRRFASYQLANMLNLGLNGKDQQIGYMVHAHCWLLLDRVIGHELILANLRVFVNAVKQFWKGNHKIWMGELIDEDYDDHFYPPDKRLRKFRKRPRRRRKSMNMDLDIDDPAAARSSPKQVDTTQHPWIVPEIQALISQGVGDLPEGEEACLREQQQPAAFNVPLDIAMMIVNTLYKDIYHNRADIDDIRNMLSAFRWRLPDHFWQSRCMKDLIFELDDLMGDQAQASSRKSVDWQFLCLGVEELLVKDGWYDRGGLKNRGRNLQLLRRLKSAFLEKLGQQEAGNEVDR